MDLADLIDFVRRYEWVVGEKPRSRYVRMAYDDRGQTVTITLYKRRSRFSVSERLHLSEIYYAAIGWRSPLSSHLKSMRNRLGNTNVLNIGACRVAYEFAKSAHAKHNQRRSFTNEPYIVHPVCAANFLLYYNAKMESCGIPFHGPTESMLRALLCHDVVEDCGVSIQELSDIIGGYSASMVKSLSKAPYYDQQLAKSDDYTKICKLCDIRDNAKDYLLYTSNVSYLKSKLKQVELLEVQHYSYHSVNALLNLLIALPTGTEYSYEVITPFSKHILELIKMGDDRTLSDFYITVLSWIPRLHENVVVSLIRSGWMARAYVPCYSSVVERGYNVFVTKHGEERANSVYRGLR